MLHRILKTEYHISHLCDPDTSYSEKYDHSLEQISSENKKKKKSRYFSLPQFSVEFSVSFMATMTCLYFPHFFLGRSVSILLIASMNVVSALFIVVLSLVLILTINKQFKESIGLLSNYYCFVKV